MSISKISNQSFHLGNYLTQIESSIISILERPCKKKATFDVLSMPGEQQLLDSALHLKQIQMKYGEIWQTVLGDYDGFSNLKIGHECGLDIISTSRKIVIELKNSYHTDNASSRSANFDKLASFKKMNNDYIAIYGVINEKGNEGKIKTYYHNDVPIQYYSGDKLFEFLLGEHADVIVNKVIETVHHYKQKNYML